MLLSVVQALLFTGCRKDFEKVDKVHFDVTTESPTFKVGEPVIFKFTGNPDYIIFYSGEVGNDYAYAATDRILDTHMTFTMSVTTSSGTPGHLNPAICPFSYSTDFSGEYTEEAVKAATWHDITDLFGFPVNELVSAKILNEVTIDDCFENPDEPVYFSFYYKVSAAEVALGNGRTQWNIQNPKINGVSDDGYDTLYDITDMAWNFILAEDSAEGWGGTSGHVPDVNTSRMLLRSEFTPTVDREMWAVSGPIHKMDNINNGYDRGFGVKAYAEASLSQYAYTYNTPGEYNVVFVAANSNAYDRKEKVCKITINVVEDEGSISQPQPEEWN